MKQTITKEEAQKLRKELQLNGKGFRASKLQQAEWLLSCIDTESEDATPQDKVTFALSHFDAEYNHPYNMKRLYLLDRLAEWLQGLPTGIHIPFYNDEILKTLLGFGVVPQGEAHEQRILEEYWRHTAYLLLDLGNAYELPIYTEIRNKEYTRYMS